MSAARQGWFSIAALFAILSLAGPAGTARAASGPTTILHFNIPAGKLVDRMTTFAIQSEVQVLYKFDGTESITTRAVLGDYTPAQALERMLEGTDIVPEFVKPQTVALKRQTPQVARSIGTGRAGTFVARNREAWKPTDRRGARSEIPLEVAILGRRPGSASSFASLGTLTLDRADIDATGLATVPEVIRTLPQVWGGGPSEDTSVIGREAPTNTGRGYGVNVRGLDAGSALVLFNGHRLAVGGLEGLFVDISSLPLQAVESIQIIPESSSTLYGADAASGTVNFVMRDGFPGRLTTGHFGTTTKNDLTESYASQIFGGQTDSGAGLLAFDFYRRGNLEAARRAQVTSDLTRFGGADFDQSTATPGTMLIGNTTYAIPRGQDGTHLDLASLTAGTRNERDKYEGFDVLPEQQRWSVFGTWKNELTDSVSLFSDALFSERAVRGHTAAIAGNIPLPPSNPFRANVPPNVPVLVAYSFANELGNGIGDGHVKTDNIAAGLDWDISLWNVLSTLAYASERLDFNLLNGIDNSALVAALFDPNPATALNLLGDGNHTNPATIEKLRSQGYAGSRSDIRSFNVTANGPVLPLPGGSVTIAAGAEYREHSFSSETRPALSSPLFRAGSERSVRSLFAEARLPLWSKTNRLPGLEQLSLSIGARQERYSDFGRSTTPHYALEWSPLAGLTFRGSRSRSFRAPSLIDMNEMFNAATRIPLADPSAPGGVSSALIWSGKNADLREETARNWTAGFDFAPRRWRGLSLAATYFDIDFTDRLTTVAPRLDLLSNPVFSDLVIRNPSAAQVAMVCGRAPQSAFPGICAAGTVNAIVDLRLRNDARLHTRGFDVIGKYVHEGRLGLLSFDLNGTYIIDFATAFSSGQPLLDRVSTQSSPIDLRLRGSAGWKRGGLDVTAFANFSNHYRDTASAPVREVSSFTTFDLNVAYTLSRERGWGLGETTFALSAQNLFDRDPPFLNNTAAVIGYDQENADIIGRFVSATIRQSW